MFAQMNNAASGQDQHDVFGEVISAIHMCSEAMPSMRPLRPGLWKIITPLADRAAAHWEHPDHGLSSGEAELDASALLLLHYGMLRRTSRASSER
jgi:hypothetical protein